MQSRSTSRSHGLHCNLHLAIFVVGHTRPHGQHRASRRHPRRLGGSVLRRAHALIHMRYVAGLYKTEQGGENGGGPEAMPEACQQ